MSIVSAFKLFSADAFKKRHASACLFLEAPPGFGPGNHGFAVRCLTTWLWRHMQIAGRSLQFDFGAAYEDRTRYLHLGKVALYRMS